ncbi:MAG: hypothetical protein AB7L90_20120 [Hyphomicrobiaceae bacterium]
MIAAPHAASIVEKLHTPPLMRACLARRLTALRGKLSDAEGRLARLYQAIENGVADASDPAFSLRNPSRNWFNHRQRSKFTQSSQRDSKGKMILDLCQLGPPRVHRERLLW